MKPKVSIITPTYNHEEFFSQCIESVINQTLPEWEQIIVEDASSDRTLEIASAYAKRDRRIKIIKHKENWGIRRLADIYNQALEQVSGDYIAILEGDDFWPPDKLEKQIASLKYSDVVLAYGDCVMTNRKGQPIRLFTYSYEKQLLENFPTGSILNLFTSLDFSIIPVTVVIRRNSLLSIGGFQKDIDYPFVDIPTFLRLSLEGRFFYQKEILGFYRKQPNSSWFRFAEKTGAMGRSEIQKCINSFLERFKKRPLVRKILKEKNQIILNQNELIKKKQKMKKLSSFLNHIAFEKGLSPLLIIFVFEYTYYKIKKFFD